MIPVAKSMTCRRETVTIQVTVTPKARASRPGTPKEERIRKMSRKKIKEMEVMVADIVRETPDTSTLYLFTGNDRLDYKAGHFIQIDPHQFEALGRWTQYLEDLKGTREKPRAYSLASAPHERYLAITVKEERYVSGKTKYPPLLSPVLAHRTPRGTQMQVVGFTGPYTYPDDLESVTDHVVHICAGSGVVPSYGLIKHALHSNIPIKQTLLLGNRTWNDVIYRSHLQELAADFPDRLQVVHALSREENPERHAPNCVHGRVGAGLIREHIPDPSAAVVYTCGPAVSKWEKRRAKEEGWDPAPRFMESVLTVLADLGVPKDRIRKESYG